MKKQIAVLVLMTTLAWGQGRPPVDKISLLRDTNVAGVTDGQILMWQASSQKWIPGSPVGSTDATLPFTDVTTNNASTSKHGFMPKLDNVATHFFNGQGALVTPSGVTDVTIPVTDNTSNNVTSSAHGWAPKGDGNASHFLNGTGGYTNAGGGTGGDFSSNTSTSVDGEVVEFLGTGGKTGKRATGSGFATLVSGVLGVIAQDANTAHFLNGAGGLTTPQQVAQFVFAYNSSNIVTTNVTPVALTFNTEIRDDDTMHSTSSNTSRLVCHTAGVFSIHGNVLWATNGTGIRVLYVLLNGTTTIDYVAATTTQNSSQEVNVKYPLGVNDYVELYADQSSGGNLNVIASGVFSPSFSMIREGP